MNRNALVASLLVISLASVLAQESKKQNLLKDHLGDTGVHGSWIYEDIQAGYAQAKKTGKPLLVGFR